MFKNYFLIVFRNILKNKTYAFVNIAGLSVSMAILIIVLAYVESQYNTNKFNVNYNNIYKISKENTPLPVADIIRNGIPGFKSIARVKYLPEKHTIRYGKNFVLINNIINTEPDYFTIFTFPLLYGDNYSALNDPSTIYLTEKQAKIIFGSQNPYGKTVLFDNKTVYVVRGIIKDLPVTSSFQFNAVIPLNIEEIMHQTDPQYLWTDTYYETYALAEQGYTKDNLQKQVHHIMKKNVPSERITLNADLVSLNDVYYNEAFSNISLHGSYEKIYILISIGLLILLSSVINYVNISIARSASRLKEIGVRKTMGALRSELIKQFITESVLMSLLSFFIGIVIAEEIMPVLNRLTGYNLLVFADYKTIRLLFLIMVSGFIGIMAGIYPAWYLTSIKTSLAAKGALSGYKGKTILRKSLLVFQFVLASILISTTIIILEQNNYIKNHSTGYYKKNIVYFPTNPEILQNRDAFKNKLLAIPGVKQFTYSMNVPAEITALIYCDWKYQGEKKHINFYFNAVSPDFVTFMKMKIVKGRTFTWDSSDVGNVIVNEAFVKQYGVTDPLKASIPGWFYGKGDVVGVVKNFNYQSLHNKIEPLAFFNIDLEAGSCILKLELPHSVGVKPVISKIAATWKEFSPDYPFDYSFLEDTITMQYKAEEIYQDAFLFFAVLAVFIACLGLFGFTAFITESRTKEIGIRKILGASVVSVTSLITGEFAALLLAANIIAWPIAYWIINYWLMKFAYKVNISIWLFILTGLLVYAISAVTIGYQAIKAAAADPVKSLKYE